MKKTLLTLVIILAFYCANAQTFNPTYSISAAGAVNTFVGGYTFAYKTSGSPWSGAFMSFGGVSNNYDCQINTDYGANGGHISFRTHNGDNGTWNPWNEIWHGGNLNKSDVDFSAKNIYAYGNVGIGTTDPSSLLHLNGTITPSATGTDILTIQAAHTSAVLGSGGVIRFTSNLSTSDAAAIRTYTDGVGLVSLRFQTGYGAGTLTDRMVISNSGNVSIGTSNGNGYKFAVNGSAIATSMTVKLNANWPDYVFKPEYQLPSLSLVKEYIDQHHHLPEIPSEQEIAKDGLNLGEMNRLLVKKVEELTLYLVEKDQQLEDQQKINQSVTQQLDYLTKQLNALKQTVIGNK